MNDLVIYDNNMNKLVLGNLAKVSQDLFFTICLFMKDRGGSAIEISFSDLRSKIKYRPSKDHNFVSDLADMSRELTKVNTTVIRKAYNEGEKEKIEIMPLFSKFTIIEEDETLNVQLNPEFVYLLNEFEQYTSFLLNEFVGFKSKFTKNLFRYLKQWNSTGEYWITGEKGIRDFREKIGIKDTLVNAEMTRILKKSCDEINNSNCSIKNLNYEILTSNKRGAPMRGIVFRWDTNSEAPAEEIQDDKADELYTAIESVLKGKGKFSQSDVETIVRNAKKMKLDETQAIERIQTALKTENVDNLVGYIIRLFEKYSPPVKTKTKMHNFIERDVDPHEYDYLISLPKKRIKDGEFVDEDENGDLE